MTRLKLVSIKYGIVLVGISPYYDHSALAHLLLLILQTKPGSMDELEYHDPGHHSGQE